MLPNPNQLSLIDELRLRRQHWAQQLGKRSVMPCDQITGEPLEEHPVIKFRPKQEPEDLIA